MKRGSEAISAMARTGCLVCLTPLARFGRVYWLTELGVLCQRVVRQDRGRPPAEHFAPDADWDIYGQLCSSHRRTVVLTIGEPISPAAIKRVARAKSSLLRMSANNVRDVIRFLMAARVVRAVRQRKRRHPLYELTWRGKVYQELLRRAAQRPW